MTVACPPLPELLFTSFSIHVPLRPALSRAGVSSCLLKGDRAPGCLPPSTRTRLPPPHPGPTCLPNTRTASRAPPGQMEREASRVFPVRVEADWNDGGGKRRRGGQGRSPCPSGQDGERVAVHGMAAGGTAARRHPWRAPCWGRSAARATNGPAGGHARPRPCPRPHPHAVPPALPHLSPQWPEAQTAERPTWVTQKSKQGVWGGGRVGQATVGTRAAARP